MQLPELSPVIFGDLYAAVMLPGRIADGIERFYRNPQQTFQIRIAFADHAYVLLVEQNNVNAKLRSCILSTRRVPFIQRSRLG